VPWSRGWPAQPHDHDGARENVHSRYTELVAVRLSVALDSKILEWAREQAERENTSVSKLIARIIEREKAGNSDGR
jgi:predicted DNA-binding ribbon-helix-helix protein